MRGDLAGSPQSAYFLSEWRRGEQARGCGNRALGRAGEEHVLAYERGLADGGTGQLARKVRWVSEEDGDWAGHDIASFAPVGLPRRIEAKTTNGWERPPFDMTPNELAVDEERRSEWRLFRL